ncbi:endonuclease-reverse transcriptase [Elysia marginata]|uniref:Endonuclease-reverse transcriptase n=1 Tax=Elysia marginata TaxID=1093978 RepID=A0AAV4HSF8_9GAST|nr:endonuclease-reverse transcriptase [Elysia marginata]
MGFQRCCVYSSSSLDNIPHCIPTPVNVTFNSTHPIDLGSVEAQQEMSQQQLSLSSAIHKSVTKTMDPVTGYHPTPKKRNLKLCQNYRTISLISHHGKVMLKVILNRIKPEAEKNIADEQAGFRPGLSTVENKFAMLEYSWKSISSTNRSFTMSS